MPFARKSRAQLIDEAASDIESRLAGVDARLRRNLVYIFATALGGAMDGLYGYMAWAVKQLFADSMDAEYIVRRASQWGLAPNGATAAQPVGQATGTDGRTVPEGTVLQRSDGALYTVNADATIANGVASVTVTAQVPGSAGNCAVNSTLQFQQPITGISNVVTITSVGLEGNDAETPEELRARVDERQAQPPQGGNSTDYIEWAKEVTGVTRAWTLPRWMGPGTVGLTFVMDDRDNIIPLEADVTAVFNYVNAKRPVRATLYVIAPNVMAIDTTYHLTPNTEETQEAAAAALADLITRQQTANGGTILTTDLDNAVKNAAGVTTFTRSAPMADIVTPAGTIAMPGTASWA